MVRPLIRRLIRSLVCLLDPPSVRDVELKSVNTRISDAGVEIVPCVGVWGRGEGVLRPCPPVRDDIVTSGYLF